MPYYIVIVSYRLFNVVIFFTKSYIDWFWIRWNSLVTRSLGLASLGLSNDLRSTNRTRSPVCRDFDFSFGVWWIYSFIINRPWLLVRKRTNSLRSAIGYSSGYRQIARTNSLTVSGSLLYEFELNSCEEFIWTNSLSTGLCYSSMSARIAQAWAIRMYSPGHQLRIFVGYGQIVWDWL